MSHVAKCLLALMFVGALLGVGFDVGQTRGRAEGHIEQRKLDDAWYAAHPVVKEVPPPIDKAGLELAYQAGANWGVKTTLEECRKRFAATKPSNAKP